MCKLSGGMWFSFGFLFALFSRVYLVVDVVVVAFFLCRLLLIEELELVDEGWISL